MHSCHSTVNAAGELVGLVSEDELIDWHDAVVRALAKEEAPDPSEYARRLQTDTASDIMTHPTPAIDESVPLGRVTRLLREHRAERVPITHEGEANRNPDWRRHPEGNSDAV